VAKIIAYFFLGSARLGSDISRLDSAQLFYGSAFAAPASAYRSTSRPLLAQLAVPNVTAHPSTASVLITVLVYSGPLLCCFNVPVKEFSS